LDINVLVLSMHRWNIQKLQSLENHKVDKFISEVIELSKRHNLSLAHEDKQGAFIIEQFKPENITWLETASDNTEATPTTKI